MLNTYPKPDVIIIQEHRLSHIDYTEWVPQLEFMKGPIFWNAAVYSAREDSLAGGTAILTSHKLAEGITAHGVIVRSRVQYIILERSRAIKTGILNIYSPNYTRFRSNLW